MFLAISGLAQTAPAPPAEVPLKLFSSNTIGFSAWMPAPVKQRAAKGEIENNAAYLFEFSSVSGTTTFQVTVTYLSGNVATPVQIKQRFRESLEKLKVNAKYKWLSGGDYVLEGNPGIEYRIEPVDNDSIVWSRQYFAFGKIYETSVQFPKKQPEPKAAAAFMESLKILRSMYTTENLPPYLLEQIQAPTQAPSNVVWVEGVEKVAGQTLAINAVKKSLPKIPKTGTRGTVQVHLIVSEEGKLISVTAINGEESLQQACLEAVKLWVFQPILVNGKPTKVQGVLAFKFGD